MTEIQGDTKELSYDAKYTYRVNDRYNVLESFRLEAEGTCRCRGERQLAEILFTRESVLQVIDGEVRNIGRHIYLHL